jgi:hypothetical protein
MASKFDLDKTYTQIISKKELIRRINACYDKEFIVCLLPRAHDNADMIIRSLKIELDKSKVVKE